MTDLIRSRVSSSSAQNAVLFRRLWSSIRWIFHPIVVFVILQVLWVAVVVLWVVWFVDIKEEILEMSQAFGAKHLQKPSILAVLVAGCILLGMLAAGITILFAFGQRQAAVIRQQRSFLSSVTHELRSPLAAIQLALETLARPNIKPEIVSQILSHGMADVERLRRLVDQILVSSRFDRGLVPFDASPEQIHLPDLVHGIIARISRVDCHQAERIETNFIGPPEIYSVKMAITLVLANLVENALKYSAEDGGKIAICIHNKENTVLFEVSDPGIGMDRKEMRRVFKMFHRSERAVRQAIPGTGLGLYIVRSATQMLKGKVWVESAGRGKGSTFFVELPNKAKEREAS